MLAKITPAIGICAVAALEIVALVKGVDSQLFSASIGAICLISGYWVKKIKG